MNRARLCALLCVYAVCVVTWIKEAPRRGAVKNSNGVDEKVNVGFRSIVPRTPPSLSFPFSYPARLPSLIDSPSRLPGFPSFDQSFYGAADVRSVFEWRTYTRARARAYTRIHTRTRLAALYLYRLIATDHFDLFNQTDSCKQVAMAQEFWWTNQREELYSKFIKDLEEKGGNIIGCNDQVTDLIRKDDEFSICNYLH